MAKTVYIKTGLTGGAATDLDGIDGSNIVNADVAMVFEGDQCRIFEADTSVGGTEDSPRLITPDANAGTIRWVLQEGSNEYVKTMTGNETFTAYAKDMRCYLDAGGSARTFNPSGTFPNGHMVFLFNTGGETITFDSATLNAAVSGGDLGIFGYDGTNWH